MNISPEPMLLNPPVTVAVINFNGASTLHPTIESILKQDYPEIAEIRLVDNHSTDTSLELVRSAFGERVRIVSLPDNRGPNPARNQALKNSGTPLVIVMDNDIILAPDYVRKLAAAFALHPEAGAVSGQIRLHEQPDVIQYNGAFIHYAGEVVANRTDSDEPVRVGVVPTGALMVSREHAAAVGFLDEEFIFGWADGDFTHRLALAGFPCYVVSRAVCLHMQKSRGMKWVRYQIRNRWWFILKYYHGRTLLLALPGIILYQSCAAFFFIFKGQGLAVLRGNLDVFSSLGPVWRKRRAIAKIRKLDDRQLLSGGLIEFPRQAQKTKLARILARSVNAALSCYWMLIRRWIK
ncbi:MAG: glycosyltransferase family 2 protein [bacterium]